MMTGQELNLECMHVHTQDDTAAEQEHEEHIVGGASAEGIEFRPSPPHLIVNSILIACRNAKSSCRFN